jgi:Mg2+ and Co2+ transporter CorA
MTKPNGHDHDAPTKVETTGIEDTVNDIRELASQIHSRAVIERVDDGEPFEQKSHDLMLASVDKITQAWVDELVSLRENSKTIEQMVIEQAAKVKAEMTRLHLLGVQAMREAQRGHEVLQHLGTELDSMMAGHEQRH